jgi:hypothetical protein
MNDLTLQCHSHLRSATHFRRAQHRKADRGVLVGGLRLEGPCRRRPRAVCASGRAHRFCTAILTQPHDNKTNEAIFRFRMVSNSKIVQ